ncbi:MAG TPA: endonuclease/exonuclease/phosphatase family protein [Myxococcota bacterium]
MPSTLRVATWNVHSFVGHDGRKDAQRGLQVLRELDADIIALQEIQTEGPEASSALRALSSSTSAATLVLGPTATARDGFGNAVISRLPVEHLEVHDLSVKGREARNAVEVVVRHHHLRLRVFGTHFGLTAKERHAQATKLSALVDDVGDAANDVTIVLGDLNVLDPRESSVTPLLGRFAPAARLRSFPAFLPMLRLDRVLVSSALVEVTASVHSTKASRAASDHLPVVATLTFH